MSTNNPERDSRIQAATVAEPTPAQKVKHLVRRYGSEMAERVRQEYGNRYPSADPVKIEIELLKAIDDLAHSGTTKENEAYLIDDQGYFRVKHVGTWTDHDHFNMRSDVMTTYGCTESMLRTLQETGGHIEFSNDRPPAPRKRPWWRFWS